MRAIAQSTLTRPTPCALDVEVRWGDGELLAAEHLRNDAGYALYADALPAGHAGFVVQRAWIGADTHALVSVDGELAHVRHVDDRVQTLRLAEQTVVHVGPLVFRIAVARPQPRAAAASWRDALDPRQQAWTAASFGVHALALLCMALMPPKASSLSLDLMAEDTRYMRYLSAPVALEEEEDLPWTPDSASNAESEGARQAGDEGEAGKPDVARSDKRLAIKGKDSSRAVSNKPTTAAEIQQMSLLGALSAAAGNLGPSTPFGAETALGYDPSDALGKLFGKSIGDDLGFGGAGMRGTGRGGGGDATGTIGVGVLGTGEGARNALGAHGSLGPRREARVPALRVGTAEVKGSLSKEVIRRTIQRRLNELRFCYERGLAADPALSGRVSVSFLIAPSGAVQQAVLQDSTLDSKSVVDCVTAAVRRFAFPAPDGGGYVQVTYPFSFASQ